VKFLAGIDGALTIATIAFVLAYDNKERERERDKTR
jgi:hypothetical protein